MRHCFQEVLTIPDPAPSYGWLPRPRLLRFVPEEAGYVLRLEAPFGFGKSVLLRQAGAHLSDLGFRVIGTGGPALRPALAARLELPAGAEWPLLLPALAQRPTALLLDDLTPESGPDLEALLHAAPGPLLLASRLPLDLPILLTMQAEGRLTTLGAAPLAFTASEAAQLGQDPAQGAALWQETLGWPLPLALAALGSSGSDDALRRGLELSLSAAALDRLRVRVALDGLDGLPNETDTSLDGLLDAARQPAALLRRLLASGERTAAAVRAAAAAWEPALRGAAYERMHWHGDLAQLLETSPGVGQRAPAAVIRWDRHLAPGGPARGQEVAWAYVRTGALRAGAQRFEGVARDERATVAQRLDALGNAAFSLAESELEAAQALLTLAAPLLENAAPEDAAQFLNRAAHVDYLAGELERGVARLSAALTLLPAAPRQRLRSNIAVNLAMQRWWLDGDSDAHLAVRERELTLWGDDLPPAVRLAHRWNLGVTALLGGRPALARRFFRDALQDADAQPLTALHCRCFLTLQEGRLDDMPALWAEVESYADPDAEDRVLCEWVLELVRQGRAGAAVQRLEGRRGPMIDTVRALALHRAGHTALARAALPDVPDPARDREKCLYARATRYRVTRDPAELAALIALTTEGARVLATFVPLGEVPREHPEYSVHHDLSDVLALGWKEAAALRRSELPPLELSLLGGLEVRVLGQPVALTGRPRDILILTALGQPRSAVAEALWPEVSPDRSRNNLHVNLNQLRRLVEPWGIATYLQGSGLQRCICDLWALQDALSRGDWAFVRQQYRPLLPGTDLPQVAAARDLLAAQVVGGAVAWAETLPDAEAESWLEWVLTLDPLHEGAMQALLTRLLTGGRRVTAERRYQAFARLLWQELKLAPSRPMQALFRAV